MVVLVVLMIAITFCAGQENAKVTYEDECNKVGHTLTINAEYTGDGTPSSVTWSYSGDVGSFLEILTSNCDVFGSVPVGFPDPLRLSYKCVTTDSSLPPNIFKLKVSGLLSNETDKTWGATFTPPLGAAPAAVELGVPTICTSCKCDCEECKKRVWICISFSCIGIAPEVIFVVGLLIASVRKTKLVVFAAIVIVIEIISGGVCISVPAEKCCTECCENWYEPLSITFIVISCIVAAAGLVELGLVIKNIIGPGRNGH